MRVAYVTTFDPADRLSWSGTGSAMMESLRASGLGVAPFGPLKMKREFINRAKGRIYRHAFGKMYRYDRNATVTRDYARQIRQRLVQNDCDIVLSPGIIPISRLDCTQPIAVWTDATWASYIKYHNLETELCREMIGIGHRTERSAFRRCSLMMFASDYAADSAIRDYGADPEKVKVVPFGANFMTEPGRDDVLRNIAARSTDVCRLVSIGTHWQRKGMVRAIELAALLNERGLRTELTIIGVAPPPEIKLPDFVKVAGFIDKRMAEGERRIAQLLGEAHFHVLFSLGDAFGVVFAEANAYGVPNIATDIGGVATAVRDGLGGKLFPVDGAVEDVSGYIEALMADHGRYSDLCMKARREYEDRLNWKTAGMQVRRHLESILPLEVLERPAHPAAASVAASRI